MSPVGQGHTLMSKGCVNKTLLEMGLCLSMTRDRGASLHAWLEEVSVPSCSSLVTELTHNRPGGAAPVLPHHLSSGPVMGDGGLPARGGSAPGARGCPHLSGCLCLMPPMLYLADTGLL